MNCPQHKNNHESISHKMQRIGVLCCGFKSIFTGTAALQHEMCWKDGWWMCAWAGSALWLSAPTPRSLETCCKVVLWSYKGIRRNQPWELFVFQCLPKDVCCVWWSSCIMEQLLRACFSISGGFSLFEDSTNTKKKQDRFLLFLLFLNASAEKVHRFGKMKVLSSRTSTAAASITDPLLQGCLLM